MNVNWEQSHDGAAGLHPILAADPAMRDGGACLDRDLVADHLRRAFPELPVSGGLVLVNVWYIPAKSLRFVYRINGPHDVTRSGDPVVALQFMPARERAALAEAARAAAVEPAHVRLLPSLSASASLFPEDRALRQLGIVLDERYITNHVGPCGPWTLLSYLPERRCALRYPRYGGAGAVVLRVQTPQAAIHSYSLTAAAWQAASRRFRMPKPVSYDARAGAIWETFMPGERLDAMLGSDRFEDALTETVRGIVQMHELAVAGLLHEGVGEILAQTLRKAVPKAAAAVPQFGPEFRAFTERLIARAREFDDGAPVTLHGDLHTANLLLDDDGVVFIDLDRMALGNPACDLALLGTRLLLVAFDRRAGIGEVARAIASLPDRYRDAGGRAIDPAAYAWYVAAMLVGRQIKTVIRHLAPNALSLVPALLGCALRILEQGRVDAATCGVREEDSRVCETTNQA